MKKIPITLIGICLLLLGIVAVSPLSKIHRFSQDVLEEQVRTIEMEMYPLLTEPALNQDRIADLKKELLWFDLEIKRQRWLLDFFMWLVLCFSSAYIGFCLVTQKKSNTLLRAAREIRPTEKYVDEYGFERAQASGFASKEDALMWFQNDKMRMCEYCGGENVPIRNTSPNQIQFCTFYKEVPENAQDLRIVLGSVWNVIPASKLICKSCSTQTQRG